MRQAAAAAAAARRRRRRRHRRGHPRRPAPRCGRFGVRFWLSRRLRLFDFDSVVARGVEFWIVAPSTFGAGMYCSSASAAGSMRLDRNLVVRERLARVGSIELDAGRRRSRRRASPSVGTVAY